MKFVITLVLGFVLYSCSSDSKPVKTTTQTKEELQTSKEEKIPLPNGEFITYHPNGLIKLKGNTVNDKREGTWFSFYDTGIKQSENNYVNGVLSGKTISYFPSGKIRYVGYYKNGKKTGEWRFYSEDGSVEKTMKY